MVRPASPERDTAIAMIRKNVEEHGIRIGVRLAREHFAHVPAASWARWRLLAVGYVSQDESIAISTLSDEVRGVIPAPEKLVTRVGDALPAVNMALRFWEALDELESDVQLLREFALVKSADGKTKVRVPAALRDAHKMRCDLLRFALLHSETAYGVERVAKLFDAVINAVGDESPDCQRRIIARLSQLKTEAERRGF